MASVLWLGRILPLPLSAGDRVYSNGLCGAVARAGARIVFLGIANPDEPVNDWSSLDPSVEWRMVSGPPRSRLLSLVSMQPMVGARFATMQYRKTLAHELATTCYDAVVFDQYSMAWAVGYVKRFARNRPRLIHICHNFETVLTADIARNYTGSMPRKLVLLQNAWKTRLVERTLARECDIAVALTDSDRTEIEAINPHLKTMTLPPGYCSYKRRTRTIDAVTPRRAVIVGSFCWIAKQMNLRRFLAAANGPFTQRGIELHVIGVIPEGLASLLKAQFPWVVFRGFVEDLTTDFENARLALVPEETGGGFKLKILDYVFGRVPVAAMDSALNGIADGMRSYFLTGQTLEELTMKIIENIDDLQRLNSMQNHAFELAADVFSWERNGQRFLDALQLDMRSSLLVSSEKIGRSDAPNAGLGAVRSTR